MDTILDVEKPLKMSKKDVDYYFKLFCKELDNNIDYIIFRKLKNYSGYCLMMDDDTIHIELDPREDILPVLIHELTHAIFPDMSEDAVLIMERSLINRLTVRQYKTLLSKAIPKIRNKKSILQ